MVESEDRALMGTEMEGEMGRKEKRGMEEGRGSEKE